MKTIQILLISVALVIMSSCKSQKQFGGKTLDLPCKDKVQESPFMAYSTSQDMTMEGAHEDAFTNGRIDLALKQKNLTEGALRRFRDKTIANTSTPLDSRLSNESDIFTYVSEHLQGIVISCEEYRENQSTGLITCFMLVTIDQEAFQNEIFNMEVLKTKFEREKFRESYLEELQEYKTSKGQK